MNRTLARRLILFAVAIGVLTIAGLSVKRLLSDETTDLQLAGLITSSSSSAGPAGETIDEFRVRRWQEWLSSMGEPVTKDLMADGSRETYRFGYQRSFHPQVCVSAWKDGNGYWIRTSVLKSDPMFVFTTRWEKTRPLAERKWKRLQALFSKRPVIDPLNGQVSQGGIDGSTWRLESVVEGKVTTAELSSPIRAYGLPKFEWIKADPGYKDFVEAGLLMLDWGEVVIPEMY